MRLGAWDSIKGADLSLAASAVLAGATDPFSARGPLAVTLHTAFWCLGK